MSHPNLQNSLSMEKEKLATQNTEEVQKASPDQEHTDDKQPSTVPYAQYQALQNQLLEEKKKMEEQIWLDQTLLNYEVMLRENTQKNIHELSEIILSHIAKVIKAVYGAFFILDPEQQTVNAIAGYACTLETMQRTQFKVGEGLIGQVAKTKEILYLENIETQLDSSLGRISSTTLIIAPIILEQKILGIIELNTLSKAHQKVILLLQKMSYQTALSVHNLQYAQTAHNGATEQALNQLQEKLEEKENQLKHLKQQLEQKQEETAQASTLEKATQEAFLEIQLQQLQNKLQEKETKLQWLQENQGNTAENHLPELEELAQQLIQTQTALAHTQAELAQKENDWQEAQEQLAQLRIQEIQEKNPKTEEIQHWHEEMEEAEKQIQALNTKNEALEIELNKRANDYEMLKETIKWKDAEIDRQDDAILEKKKITQNLEKELALIQAENLKGVEEIIKQGKIIKSKEEEITSLKQQIEQAPEINIDELNELKQALTQKESEIDELKIYLQESKQALEKASNTLEGLEQAIEQKNQEISQLQQQVHQNQEQLTQQTQQLNQHTALLRKKEDELLVSQYLLNQKQEDETENNPITDALKEEIKILKEQIKQTKEQAALQQEKAQKSQQELQTQLEAQNNTNIDALYAEIQALNNQLKQQETANKEDEVKEIRAQLEQKENEIKSIKDENLMQNEAIESLKEGVFQKEKQIEQLHAIQTQQNPYQDKQDKQDKQEELENTLEELRRKEHELLQQTDALSNLRTQLLEKEKQIEQLKKERKNQGEVPDLEEVNQKISQLEDIQNELTQKEHEIEKQNQTIKNQKSEILEKHLQLEILKDAIGIKEQENKQQNAQIKSQQEQLLARQEELSQKEEELTSLFNKINSAFAALEFDMNGKILSINNKFLMLLGRKIQEMETQPIEMIFPEEFYKSMEYILLWEGLKMGVTQTTEQFTCIGSKGREIKMSVTFIPILDKQGKPYEVVQLVNQVYAEPKENNSTQNNTSQEGKQKLDAFNNSFILAELNLKGIITATNHNFSINLGYDDNEALGKHHREFIDITDRNSPQYENIIQQLNTEKYSTGVFKYLGKEGEIVRLRSHFHPILDQEQNPSKILVISQLLN